VAEVIATQQIIDHGPAVLYYVAPVAVHHDDHGLVDAVAVAAKAGVRWLRARQWIDATDTGELARLIDPSLAPARAETQTINLFYRHVQWPTSEECEVAAPVELPGSRLSLRPTLWENERCLTVELPGQAANPRLSWVPAMRACRHEIGEAMKGAVLTHGSVVPLVRYAQRGMAGNLPANVVACGAAWADSHGLAGRFERGLEAAEQALAAPTGAAQSQLPETPEIAWRELRADVAVAGVGTGGALAAIAAAREGASVRAFDPLPFAGGIGSGGGIHHYYFGVRGGLQDELDQQVREVMNLFGSAGQVRGFHPDAKKLVLDQMLLEAGVELTYEAAGFGVERTNGRVTHAHLATPGGAVRLSAEAWIDATGDGDLAAQAGASFRLGRSQDGMLHAYSQSSGRAVVKEGLAQMSIVNYDAGFVDPTDEQDLTRGRLVGISHYVQQQYTPLERPTYIAPAIGLRQGRQVETEYLLTLADQIERREFPDAIGYTGAHYDNHSVDYEFESDEAMFWVWACQQWREGRTASQISYRMLLPRGLDNVLLACRAAGVSEEAHHSFRMQRDMQRIGEAAGYAAAMVAARRVSVRDVPMEQLRQRLQQTGALRLEEGREEDHFGSEAVASLFASTGEEQVQAWIEQVRSGPGLAMWRLMRHEAEARPAVEALLRETDAGASWRAACILAMWNDPIAEERLCEAVRRYEYGHEDAELRNTPDRNAHIAPRWLAATALLRCCGTARCLAALEELAQRELPMNGRTAAAITIQRVASRLRFTEQEQATAARTLTALRRNEPANRVHGFRQPLVAAAPAGAERRPTDRVPAVEDWLWQLHLSIAQAEKAIGLPIHAEAKQFLADPRATVRRSFQRLL
jgi:hypothetical protein